LLEEDSDVQCKKKINKYPKVLYRIIEASEWMQIMSKMTFSNWIQTGWRVYRRTLSYSNYILDYKYKHSSLYLTIQNSLYRSKNKI
jgi:hypothetical protein